MEGCRKAVLGVWAKLQAPVYDILLVEERCRKAKLGVWAKLQALAYHIIPLVGRAPESAHSVVYDILSPRWRKMPESGVRVRVWACGRS